MVFSHKNESYAETCRSGLLPQRFALPVAGHPHRGRGNNRVFREQCLEVLRECVSRIDAVEPVGDVAQMGIEFVGSELTIGNPSIGKMARKAGVNNNLLLEREQLLVVSHKRVSKKMSRPGTLHSLRTRSGGGFY